MKSHKLAEILMTLPDCQIVIARDKEGNGFGTILNDAFIGSIEVIAEKADMKGCGIKQPLIVLYPFEEFMDLSEIPKEA